MICYALNGCISVIVLYLPYITVIPIITITRTPDTEMVDDNVRVTVMCSVKSNPQPSINWEQIAEDVMDVTRTATTQHTMNSIFNFTSISSISFTNENISGFSKFCCTASNSIGTAEKCLNFTETGKLRPSVSVHLFVSL